MCERDTVMEWPNSLGLLHGPNYISKDAFGLIRAPYELADCCQIVIPTLTEIVEFWPIFEYDCRRQSAKRRKDRNDK